MLTAVLVIVFSILYAYSLSNVMFSCMHQKLEAGQVKLQSRLEEEEQAKAALMGRIQRLTKLILVSTKSTMPSSVPGKLGHRRRHSFGEDEVPKSFNHEKLDGPKDVVLC